MYIRLYRIGSYGRLTEKEHLPFWALRAVPLVIELGSCKSRTYPQGQNKEKYPPPPPTPNLRDDCSPEIGGTLRRVTSRTGLT